MRKDLESLISYIESLLHNNDPINDPTLTIYVIYILICIAFECSSSIAEIPTCMESIGLVLDSIEDLIHHLSFLTKLGLGTIGIDFDQILDIIKSYKSSHNLAADSHSCNKLVQNCYDSYHNYKAGDKGLFNLFFSKLIGLKNIFPVILGGFFVNQTVMMANQDSNEDESNRAESSRAGRNRELARRVVRRRDTIASQVTDAHQVWRNIFLYGEGDSLLRSMVRTIVSKLGEAKFIAAGFEFQALSTLLKPSLSYYFPWADGVKGPNFIHHKNFFGPRVLDKRCFIRSDGKFGFFGARTAANCMLALCAILLTILYPRMRFILNGINADLANNILDFDKYYKFFIDSFDAGSMISLANCLREYASQFDTNNLIEELVIPPFFLATSEASFITEIYPELLEHLHEMYAIPFEVPDAIVEIYNTLPWENLTFPNIPDIHPALNFVIKNINIWHEQPFLELLWTEELLSSALGIPEGRTIEATFLVSAQNIIEFLNEILEQFPSRADSEDDYSPYSDDPKGKGRAKK